MKFKKLLAGVTAAALAVSAMAFSSLSANAEENDELFDSVKKASSLIINSVGYSDITKMAVTVDGTETVIDESEYKYEGKKFSESGDQVVVTAAQLSSAGVTADNASTSYLVVNVNSVSDGSIYNLYATSVTEFWTVDCYATYNIAITEGENKIPLKTEAYDVSESGITFQGKNFVASEISIEVPDNDGLEIYKSEGAVISEKVEINVSKIKGFSDMKESISAVVEGTGDEAYFYVQAIANGDWYDFPDDQVITHSAAKPETPEEVEPKFSESKKVTLKASDLSSGAYSIKQLESSTYKFEPDDVVKAVVVADNGDSSKWMLAFCGFDTDWNGWQSVSTKEGVLELTAKVSDIMDVNSIASADKFGGFIFQMWGMSEGDSFRYGIAIGSDGAEPKVNVIEDTGSDEPSAPADEDVKLSAKGDYEVKELDPDGLFIIPVDGSDNVLTATYGFAPEDTASVTITPAEGVDSSKWQILLKGFDYSWGGWQSLEGEEGSLTLTGTIKDIMDANSMSSISELQGFLFQIGGTAVGDKFSYELVIRGKKAAAPSAPEENVPTVTPSVPSAPSAGIPGAVIKPKAPASSSSSASGSTSVTLSDSTVVSKDAISSVSGKNAEFKLANGASWEIAGADAAKAEGMDLGITLDTAAATADQVKEVAKDNDTFQFSLNHSGDFGFTAVINVPVDAKYNGQFANLYWFHDGKFDFIGSSKVEKGVVDFRMTHASDYVIVFDDEAYGEDVSSAAGVYEESETASAAPIAIVVTLAALAVSAVILKKRVF